MPSNIGGYNERSKESENSTGWRKDQEIQSDREQLSEKHGKGDLQKTNSINIVP